MAEVELEFKRLGEEWVLLRFGKVISKGLTERIRQYHGSMQALDFVHECVPTYTDLALRVRGVALEWGAEEWRGLLSQLTTNGDTESSRLIEIPVRFAQSDDSAFDWSHYAQQINLPVEEIIDRLLATEFSVAMIGFLPGMPYLSGLPENFHLARRQNLASAVPGTFAIGGQQAGFLPNQTLTGWWRLGCADVSIFDLHRQPHGYFNLGDRVRLLRVD
jgi:KipI family sensor histidine kinase inhibitor